MGTEGGWTYFSRPHLQVCLDFDYLDSKPNSDTNREKYSEFIFLSTYNL